MEQVGALALWSKCLKEVSKSPVFGRFIPIRKQKSLQRLGEPGACANLTTVSAVNHQKVSSAVNFDPRIQKFDPVVTWDPWGGPAWARHGTPGQSAIHLHRFAEAAGKAWVFRQWWIFDPKSQARHGANLKKKQILWLSHQKCFQDFTIPSKGIDLGLQLFLSHLRGDHLAGPRSAGLPRRAAHQHRPGPSSSSRPRPVDSKQLLTSQGASRLEMAYLNSVAWHQILKTQKPSYGPQKKNTSRTRGLVYWTSSISPSQCLPTYIADDISTCLMVTLTPWTNSYVYILYTCWWLPPYHHRFISSWWNMSHPRCSYGFVWRMVPLISQLICRFGAIPNIPNSQTPSFHKISNITKLLLVIIPVISGYISYPLVI
jgi:hypothetical protein